MNYSRSEIVPGQAPKTIGSQALQVALPRVSVIITCFNYARYVSQALDSVASQTYASFDCVVVDDASTDDSGRCIEQWIHDSEDSRFRFIRNPSNRGQTACFAVGLAATSGEFVAFLDADDFWFPQFLQRHVEAHLNRSFSASVSCSDLLQIDEERRVLSGTWVGPVFEAMFEEKQVGFHPIIDSEHSMRIARGAAGLEFLESTGVKYVYPDYLEYPWTATSGMMFRRAALDLVMPEDPDELRVCTDCYMFVICHYFTGSLAIGSALGAYRRHGNNSFANNAVMGAGLACAPATITRHQKTIISTMLRHLTDHYDKFAIVFPNGDVRHLIRVLFTRALRDRIPIRDPRLRGILGGRGMLEAKSKAKLFFINRLLLRLPFRWARRLGGSK